MHLSTLGGLRLQGSDFTRPKPLLLLCYVTLEGPKSRRFLADLFFPDVKDPRDSLSTAFRHFKEMDGVLVADGRRLESRVDCDAVDLLDAIDQGRLEQASRSYEGAFLAGVDLELGRELEEWVYTTREFLAARVRDATLRMGEAAAAKGDAEAAREHGERAMSLDGLPALDVEALPRMYRLLSFGRSHMVSELLGLAEEFGVELSRNDTTGRSPEPHAVPTGGPPPNNVPEPATSFIGRDSERLDVAERLADPHCRVLTIHGPGGIGKTRLALRCARDQLLDSQFTDGVFVVSLDAVSDPDRLPEAIASVFGVETGATGGLIDELVDFIDGKQVLLILDAFEHLVEGAPMVSQLVQRASGLNILVTSRDRLNLVEEHVLRLEGLAAPGRNQSFEDAVYADALQLMVQRAKKARLDFVLREQDIADAVALCELLDGSPLGIELATAWIHAMSLAEIRQAIESNTDLLESRSRNASSGHRSMRAVFQHSWHLLRPRERSVLAELAVFRGGFRREAAAAVADATLPTIVRLADGALVQAQLDGRYTMHTVIQRLALEELDESDGSERAYSAHAEYYRTFAKEQLSGMYGSEEARSLKRLREDIGNVLQAWDHLFECGEDITRDFPTELVVFFDRLGRFSEGIRFFDRARHALAEFGEEGSELASEATTSLSWLHYRTGALAISEDLARTVVDGGRASRRASMVASNTLGLLAREREDHEAARDRFSTAMSIADELGQANRSLMYRMNLASAAFDAHDLVGAKQTLSSVIESAKGRKYASVLVSAWNNLGSINAHEGNFAAALEYFQKALERARSMGYRRIVPLILANMADASVDLGDLARAEGFMEDLQTSFDEERDVTLVSLVKSVEGRILAGGGGNELAEARFREALEHAARHPHDKRDIPISVHLAELYVTQGRFRDAARLLDAVRSRASHSPVMRKTVERLIEAMPAGVMQDVREESARLPPGVARVDSGLA